MNYNGMLLVMLSLACFKSMAAVHIDPILNSSSGDTQVIGGPSKHDSGGDPFRIECPTGMLLVGVEGSAGAIIDKIAPICISVTPKGNWKRKHSPQVHLSVGGKGESSILPGDGSIGHFKLQCSRGYAVNRMDIKKDIFNSLELVDKLNMQCAKLRSDKSINVSKTEQHGWPREILGPKDAVVCPSDTPATGLIGSAGHHIDSLGMSCEMGLLTDTPLVGSMALVASSTRFETHCRSGEALVGIYGGDGYIVDSIGAMCVSVTKDGHWAGNIRKEDKHGGLGWAYERKCPLDYAITGIKSGVKSYSHATRVGKLEIQCSKLTGRNRVENSHYYPEAVGDDDRIVSETEHYSCPENHIARGVYGSASTFLDTIGLRCDASPSTHGTWSNVIDWDVISLHSVLTAKGSVFTFGANKSGLQGAMEGYDLWDPRKGQSESAHNFIENNIYIDSFCSAPILLADSQEILVPGGDGRVGSGYNAGITDVVMINEAESSPKQGPDMAFPRWYPTATTLGNGDVLLTAGISGSFWAGFGTNKIPAVTPEVFSIKDDFWRTLHGAKNHHAFSDLDSRWWYPRMWLAKDGRAFGISHDTMFYVDPTGIGKTEILDNPLPSNVKGYHSTAVMYQPGKILQLGGKSGSGAVIIDINGDTPVIKAIEGMGFNRAYWPNATVLPDGKVLVTAGSPNDLELHASVYTAQLWDPETERFSNMSKAALARLYHGTSLLLPDGTALIAGGGAPGPLVNSNAEIFYPPYLYDQSGKKRKRLEATPTTTTVAYGSEVEIEIKASAKAFQEYHGADNVSRVTLIRTGSVTHSFDMEQRFMELEFRKEWDKVYASLPTSPNEMPPGHYMIFVLDQHGTPSTGTILNVKPVNIETYSTEQFGGAGKDAIAGQVSCHHNDVMIGLHGLEGYAIDKLLPICVSVDTQGNWVGKPKFADFPFGGGNGSPFSAKCPQNHALVSSEVAMGTGKYEHVLGYVRGQCAPLISNDTADHRSIVDLDGHGLAGIVPTSTHSIGCNNGDVAQGVSGRTGYFVDNVKLECIKGKSE
ncbi:DUF1929 domain-containing protein [Enterovibrio sp. ZSDZ42]|uniref:DUF1929 domain-containing protein n=1 Tax=Enterovibrio gelatinilyticus TaxID=2899819 RepID=A0ABT5R7Y5_9GAMM|nr:galactose oxidase early set domain-containing protein [Enterovibrio sp. ZSDZ42]MDD1796384.1 DUF1929 domain-containing protein [Enterovibrio sp. ZSDZ42]